MSGYDGYSMSNNAVDAYENGEKPISKWTKSELINQIAVMQELNFSKEKLKKLALSTLRSNFLFCSSWHHTSSHYNRTDFYSLNLSYIKELSDEMIDELIANQKSNNDLKEPIEPIEVIRKVKYVVWTRQNRHYYADVKIAECRIIGDYAYTKDGRKDIWADSFEFLD